MGSKEETGFLESVRDGGARGAQQGDGQDGDRNHQRSIKDLSSWKEEVEGINPLSLPRLPLTCWRDFPSVSCVYFAIDPLEQIHYIGQTVNLRLRIQGHRQGKRFSQVTGIVVAWLEVPKSVFLRKIETFFLNRFFPPLNKIIPLESQKTELIELREKLGLRTVDVAAQLGIGESTVRAWENGKSFPNFEVIKPLTELYGVTFDQLHEAVMQTRKEIMGSES